MERRFMFEKETKNTVRFEEIDEGEGLMIGNLYVQKDALDEMGWNGEELVVTIDIE